IAQRTCWARGRVASSVQLLANGGIENQSHKGAEYFRLRRRALASTAVAHVKTQGSKDETLFALVAAYFSFSARHRSSSAIKRREQDQCVDFANDPRGEARSASTARRRSKRQLPARTRRTDSPRTARFNLECPRGSKNKRIT